MGEHAASCGLLPGNKALLVERQAEAECRQLRESVAGIA
jgi:hypothetical protein